MKSVFVDMEDFAVGLDETLGDIPVDVQRQMEIVIPKMARATAREVKKNAEGYNWNGVTGTRYVNGFGSKVTKTGVITEAEVGNKVAGLVHLLEKGHNTIGGGRVEGKPHMKPAFDKMKRKYLKEIAIGVDKALKG